jgi:hypothetical protein
MVAKNNNQFIENKLILTGRLFWLPSTSLATVRYFFLVINIMSKRFHDTNIWFEDWFIALPKK